jgi:DNA replication and repair protein RecF
MIFTDIRVQNYRSYTDASFELGKGVNIVVGPNGAGKTNLLEALMVGAIGKSYRARDVLLPREGSDWSRIDVHTADNISRTIKLQYDPAGRLQKSFQIDDKTYARLPHQQKQPVVLFEPESLRLLHSEPSQRREYFDDIIEQFSVEFTGARNKYRRVLAQRNALLKQSSKAKTQLFAWDLRLADLAEQIVAVRRELVDLINQSISNIYTSIAKEDKVLNLHYQSNIESQDYAATLLKKLEASQELDFARGFTGFGPHRDDFLFYFGDNQTVQSASRGEIRTLILALKTIEMQIIKTKQSVRPILLFDDVFSELDGSRRHALTDFLAAHQTIITTTDADVVLKHFVRKTTVIPIG